MPVLLPETVHAWRMVASRRRFDGTLPLSRMVRLLPLLEQVEGDCQFWIEFGRDSLGVGFVSLKLDASLPLLCQRSLQRFFYPVHIEQRLGLIAKETDEAALPSGYEPLLVAEDDELNLAELVEDELILALPIVPVSPDAAFFEQEWAPSADEVPANPFMALAALKQKK